MTSISSASKNNETPLALVTGAAKRVGREIALHLARQGYAIGLHYFTSTQDAKTTANEISALGAPVILLQADLKDEAQIVSMFAELDASGYPLKILLNSASIMPRSDLLKINSDEWDNIMDTNLRSVLFCSQKAAARMETDSLIVNISDAGTAQNWTGYGAYLISKSGVDVMTRILARQLAPRIRVCGIAPGLLLKSEELTELEWDKLIQKNPMKQQGDFSSLTSTLDFLISNKYITGEIISLDGGANLG